MKRVVELTKNAFSLVFAALLFGAVFFGCGAVRQTMSFAECAPGKPAMTVWAFVVAGLGGSVCIAPKSN